MALATKRKLTSIENCSPKAPKVEASFGATFRKRLKTDQAATALGEFAKVNKERDVVTEYINAGGSAKELLSVLKQFDGKKDLTVANPVLSALQCIVSKTNTDLLLLQKSVEEACEELLCTYQTTLQTMLCSVTSSTSHRKVVLRLFTGMVNLSNNLAKRLLTLFPISLKTIKILTDTRSSNSATKLRTCFIHYLLSFLADDNVVLISELLQKKGLLSSIIPGLINDQPDTVILVLNTLRMKIVENIRISKTLKLHTFNTPTLRSLEKLYDYSLPIDQSEDRELFETVEQTVREAVHALLIMLCTSSKKGILFKERGSVAGKSANQLIFTMLENMSTPWENNLRTELVTEILKICPEFLKTIYHSMEQYIQPSVSHKWINVINFIKKMIEKQDHTEETIDDQQVLHFISSFVFPLPLQKLLHELNETIHAHPLIRYHIMSLLQSVLLKIKQILTHCKKHCHHKESVFASLKIHIDHFLNKHLIPSPHILNAYQSRLAATSEEPEESVESSLPDVNDYLTLAADLLLLYDELSPLNFNQLRYRDNIDLTCDTDHTELSFKIAHLIFQIYNPKPGQDRFAFMMKQFLECYISDVNFHRHDILQNVLLATGFFDGFEEEIIIWLNSIRNTPHADAVVISDLLTNTLCSLSKKYSKFMKDVTLVSSYEDLVSVPDTEFTDSNLLNFDQEFEHVVVLPVKLSPMVPAFLSTLKTVQHQTIHTFVSSVLVNILHVQCLRQGLSTLLQKYPSNLVSDDFTKYLNSWDNLDVDSFDPAAILDSSTRHLYRRFIVKDAPPDKELLSNATEMDCILYWNTCLFYAVQLHSNNSLDSDTSTSIITVLNSITDRLQTHSTLCLKLILTNYRFVNDFSVEHKTATTLTQILIKSVLYLRRRIIDYRFLSPYRLKFMLTILQKIKSLKRIKITCESYTIQEIVEFLSLTGKHVIELLNKLVHLPIQLWTNEKRTKLSEWSVLLACLLDEAAKNLDEPLNEDDFQTLVARIIEILRLNVSIDTLDISLITYIKAFPHHIQHISDDDIENLLDSSINKLSVFLIRHRSSHLDTLQSKLLPVEDHLDNVDDLFDVLNTIQSIGELSDEVMSDLYKSPVCDVMSLLKSEYSLKNKTTILKIFRQFAEKKKCTKLYRIIESDWFDLDLNRDKYDIARLIFEKSVKLETLVKLSLDKLNRMLTSGEECFWLTEAIDDVARTLNDLSFVQELDSWNEFVKLSLKFGLNSKPGLIRTLNTFCKALESPEKSSLIFQMTISHSEFINVMLGNSSVKCDLIELLITLTTFNVSLMSSNHVPLLLGSYTATLSKTDQLIFRLLRWYEDNNVRFTDCRPYLWGDAAVTHHSIRTELSVSLKRQPLPNQVLELLDSEIVKNTIRYFPLNRSLKPDDQYVECDQTIYDMSFVLPLMSHLLAPESRISVQKFTRSGSLALILSALSSESVDVRMAAYHCLQRFRAHLFSHEKEIQLWDHFANALKESVNGADTPPRLSCVVTTFLAQMSLIIGEPLHPLYTLLTNFLLAKPSFDIKTVPNFRALFYSTDDKHKIQQEWILNVIKYGIRCKTDCSLVEKCFIFKLLLQYSFSSISNDTVNTLVLDIVMRALQIPQCREIVTKCGILSWIVQIIRTLNIKQKPLLSSIISILSLLINVENSVTIIDVALHLLHKNTLLTDHHIETLLDVLSRAYNSCDTNTINDSTIRTIISISTPLLDPRSVKKYENCLKYNSSAITDERGLVNDHIECILRRYLNK